MTMQKVLESEQITRIHEHRMHYVNVFYQRLNSFLVFESILLGVIGLVYSRSLPSPFLIKAIATFGLAITLIWWYIQARIKYSFSVIDNYAIESMEEYGEIRAKTKREIFPNLSWILLAHAIPASALLLWVMLLIFL